MYYKKILFLVLIIIVLFLILRKRTKVILPTNISNGLTFEIPFKNKELFYIKGLSKEKLFLKDFLENKVKNDDIDNISVWFDEDLRADLSTNYSDTEDIIKNIKIVKIVIKGDINHKVVKAMYISNVQT